MKTFALLALAVTCVQTLECFKCYNTPDPDDPKCPNVCKGDDTTYIYSAESCTLKAKLLNQTGDYYYDNNKCKKL